MSAALATPPAATARLATLFRGSLREGRVHPLFHLLQRHTGVDGPMDIPPAPAAARAAERRALVDPAVLNQRVAELPALPQVLLELLAALRSDDVRLDDCANRLSRDLALSARTLRLANSAFYGVPGRVGTVQDAIGLLGLRTLGSMLTAAAVSTQFKPPPCPGFDFGGFWRHAVASGMAARAIARQRRLDQDLCFTAGLLHDIGRLALATYFPDEFSVALAEGRESDLPPYAVERAVLGVCHAEVGAAIAAHWRFPANVVEAIALHHVPRAPGDGATASAADVVHVADAVVHALDLSGDPREFVPPLALPAWARVGLLPEQCLALFEQVEAGVAEACQGLGL